MLEAELLDIRRCLAHLEKEMTRNVVEIGMHKHKDKRVA